MKIWFYFLSLFLLIGCGGDGVLLRLNPKEGQTIHYSSNVTSEYVDFYNEFEIQFAGQQGDILNFIGYERKTEVITKLDMEEGDNSDLDTPIPFSTTITGDLVQPENDGSNMAFFSKLFVPFPDEKVHKGDTWESEKGSKNPFGIPLQTYTCEEITEETIKISSTHESSIDRGVSITRNIEGTYLIDRQSGFLISLEIISIGFNGIKETSTQIEIKQIPLD